MGNPSRLFPDDPAYPRYRDLVEALGFEPTDPHDLTALAHFAMWGGHNDSRRIAAMIHQARQHDLDLLREVSQHIRHNATQDVSAGTVTVDLPPGLAVKIHTAVGRL